MLVATFDFFQQYRVCLDQFRHCEDWLIEKFGLAGKAVFHFRRNDWIAPTQFFKRRIQVSGTSIADLAESQRGSSRLHPGFEQKRSYRNYPNPLLDLDWACQISCQ